MIPALVEYTEEGTPRAPAFGDVYHPRQGGLAQSRHVFLGGNGLPARWQNQPHFVVLETGFGLGLNFLSTWQAWRSDPQRSQQLWFVSIEKHPLRRLDLLQAWQALATEPDLQALATELVQAWPPLIQGTHTLFFDHGKVKLVLALSDVRQALKGLRLKAHAFYLDGFAPARNPDMWAPEVFKAIGRLAAPDATAATWSAARDVRNGLTTAGFEVRKVAGFGGKRDMITARYQPQETRRSPPSFHLPQTRHALIIGAGLAGAACASALAAQGVHCTVLEQAGQPAAGASGNRAGLFHGVFHAEDGPHARLHRSAALLAARTYAPLIQEGLIEGRIDGLLRLHTHATSAQTLQGHLDRQQIPMEYLQACSPEQASDLSALPLSHSAWLFTQGGWLSPRHLVDYWLQQSAITLELNVQVQQVIAVERNGREQWLAQDAQGNTLACADVVVLCQAQAVVQYLPSGPWPVEQERGQITLIAAHTPHLHSPKLPLMGLGYALTLNSGDVLCGATSQTNDADPLVRMADHAFNLDRFNALTGSRISAHETSLSGRVAWRFRTEDRLPLVGAVPLAWNQNALRLRDVPRQRGLFMCAGLGSRGITWAPLLGELLAACVTGSPMPIEGDLADATDPARFMVRRNRKPSL